MKEITDADRVRYLLDDGFIPRGWEDLIVYLLKKGVDATILLDYMFEQSFGPAYWRKPKVDLDGEWEEVTYTNGLVFVRNCDRERIDLLLLGDTRNDVN